MTGSCSRYKLSLTALSLSQNAWAELAEDGLEGGILQVPQTPKAPIGPQMRLEALKGLTEGAPINPMSFLKIPGEQEAFGSCLQEGILVLCGLGGPCQDEGCGLLDLRLHGAHMAAALAGILPRLDCC